MNKKFGVLALALLLLPIGAFAAEAFCFPSWDVETSFAGQDWKLVGSYNNEWYANMVASSLESTSSSLPFSVEARVVSNPICW